MSFILFTQIQDVYSNITGQSDFNVTLPMILAEWQQLTNSSLQFKGLLERMTTELDGEYWMNWIPDNVTLGIHETLLQRYFDMKRRDGWMDLNFIYN